MNAEKYFLQPQEEYIRLCDLLKICGAFETGGQAKIAIQSGQVTVNGDICTMRGKKMHRGDKASYCGDVFEVC